MSRILPLPSSEADAATATTLAAVKSKPGMVPNLFAVFARSPAVLDGYLAFSEALGRGSLTARQREIVALVPRPTRRMRRSPTLPPGWSARRAS